MNYNCVNKGQRDADIYHADWRIIKANNRNEAKSKYSKNTNTKYIDVVCTIRNENVNKGRVF